VRVTVRAVNDAELEAALTRRALEHGCELVVEDMPHGLVRAAYRSIGDGITPPGAIGLSAAHGNRHAALRDLYDAGLPR